MTEPAPLPDGYIAHLPPLKHRFDGYISVPADQSKSGYAQTERTCVLCEAVKITVHDGAEHWREWRLAGSDIQREMADPVCVPKVVT